MFAACLGIEEKKDVEKVLAFLEENHIHYRKESSLTLFELEEAEYRMTEMYSVVDQDNNPVEVTPDLIECAADSFGNGEYFNYDVLDNLLRACLEEWDIKLVD